MIGIIVVTHGNLSIELIQSTEMIIGKQSYLESVSFLKSDGCEVLQQKINQSIKKIGEEKEIIFFVDIYGGSCFNMCQLELQKRKNVRIVSGVNLPMLLEVCLYKNSKNIDELVNISITKGQKGIK
ncbi:MAG: PTS sugar transporter subunit IIA [bacterium]